VVARCVVGRVIFVGDAACYEDALTGEGISLAVKTGFGSNRCPDSGRACPL
jgi:flavin-dependent dehydrogenase